jgi:hypothetical protein
MNGGLVGLARNQRTEEACAAGADEQHGEEEERVLHRGRSTRIEPETSHRTHHIL